MTYTEHEETAPEPIPEAIPEPAAEHTQQDIQRETQQSTEALNVAAPAFGAAEAATSEVSAAEQPAKHRIGSGRLFAGALVLGVLGGVGTGYAVQASRPPTKLPPLATTQPHYPPSGVYQGIAPAQLPASQDDATRTDGDLTALLVPMPAGANDDDSTWADQMISIDQDAYLCDDQSGCYTRDYAQGVEAVADTEWTTGNGFFVEIRMYRFAAGDSSSGRSWVSQNAEQGSTSIPMPSGVDATGYEYLDSYGDNDDHIQAVHGDIEVSFWVSSPSKKPNPSLIDGIVTQQMGRL
jgi:hypothetical protein